MEKPRIKKISFELVTSKFSGESGWYCKMEYTNGTSLCKLYKIGTQSLNELPFELKVCREIWLSTLQTHWNDSQRKYRGK